MRPLLSQAQMRAFERSHIEAGVPGIVLMENAGRGAAHWIGLHLAPRGTGKARASAARGSCVRCADEASLREKAVLVLVGPGNNGGDGWVVARHLTNRGAVVEVLALPGQPTGDAALARAAFEALGRHAQELSEISLEGALASEPLVVDALFGTGLGRPLEGVAARAVERLARSGLDVVALDLPSGLDTDRGQPLGPCVRAMHTVTFGHLKLGLFTSAGHENAGRITLANIGVPSALPKDILPEAWLLEEADLVAQLKRRSPVTHKGSAGRVSVVGGQPGMVGAPLLVGRAALRGGAGICTLLADDSTSGFLERETLELMTARVDLDDRIATSELLRRADVLVVGPGLGRDRRAQELCELSLLARRPTVLDADGLRWAAEHPELVRDHPALILTPHPGEAAALLGVETREIEADRFGALRRLVEWSSATVILKGSRTLVGAPGETARVSAWGSAALSTPGSGDVLSGVIAALWAGQGRAAFDFALLAAWLGVGLHALAGERWAAEHGDAGLLASEIADAVPKVRAQLLGELG